MRFETVRLTAICNEPKRTITISSGLGLLQMVLDSNTDWCASEDAGFKGGVCKIPHWLERERVVSYKDVEISLYNEHVLKLKP